MIKSAAKRIISLITAAVMTATVFSSCAKKYDFPESSEEEKQTVFSIGGNDVPFEQYRYFFMNYKAESDGGNEAYWSGKNANEEFARIDKLTRESLLRLYATLDLALDYEIDWKGGKIQKAVTEKINDQIESDGEDGFGGKDGYLSMLNSAYLTNSAYRFLVAEMECEEQLYSALIEDGTIKDDEETIMGAISGGEFCRAKQILIKNDPGDDPAKNRALAEEILTQAQLGEDFDALVAKYGEDPEMITSPVGYYFTHGELIEEFEDAAFALEIGEISGIVESSVGYHIILRCELDPAYVSENYSDLAAAYLTSQYYFAVNDRMEKLSFSETDLSRSLSFSDFLYSNQK